MTPTDTLATTASASPHGLADPAITQRAALPNRAYTDHNEWLRERSEVMAATWAGLGFSADIAASGAVCPIVFMGLPLRHAAGGRGRRSGIDDSLPLSQVGL